jgi:hypothetical protein
VKSTSGRGVSNLMQGAMRGGAAKRIGGAESCLGGREGDELSVFDVGLCALQKSRPQLWTGWWVGEVYSLSAASERNPLLQVPGRCCRGVLPVH